MIARLLGEEPVVILVDELADYIVRLKSSGDPVLRDYADQVLSFVEALAKAVDLSRHGILIVSMPVEERRRRVEERYKSQFSLVLSLYKSLSRVAARRIMPVAPTDIPSILRVRIFRHIDSNAAKAVSHSLARLYGDEENKEVFGENAVAKAYLVERTYPFHPSYIETLVDIVDKHDSLEKTRDAIRITRKIIRKLIESRSHAELIMPFHIDVEDREIRGILFSLDHYRQYETVVSEDVVERTGSYEKPELARTIAKTILVKTFVYAGSMRYHQYYPDKYEVIISSYDPGMAQVLNLQPKDYVDALEWAAGNLVYLVNEGGRYWFVQFSSPIRRVELTARTISDYEALKTVVDYAWKLMTRPYEDILSGSRRRSRREAGVSPFNPAASRVLVEPEPVDHDSREYILVALLTPPREEDLERIIYEMPSGGSRRYANTVYIVYPRDSLRVSQMLGFAKHLIACDIVREELDSLYRDSEIREVMRKKLEKYCRGIDGVEGRLVVNILAGLNMVAYPSFDEKNHRNTFGVTEASMADTIIETAARALRSARPPKLYDELDFEELDFMLSNIGISLSEGDTARRASDIIDYFYSNPRLPMVSEDTIKEALIEGVRTLSIGIKRNNRIFFKKIYECRSRSDCSPPSLEEGEAPPRIEAGDLVLPWKIALLEQVESLKEVTEERVNGGIRRIWHAFYIQEELVPVTEALNNYDIELLHKSPIVRVVELVREGVEVKLDQYEVTVGPGEEAVITAFVERVGGFRGELEVAATGGELSSTRIRVDDENPSASIEWRIKAPDEPGTYNYEFWVEEPTRGMRKSATVTIVVRQREREVASGVPPKGTKLSMVEVEVSGLNFRPLRIIDAKFSSEAVVEEALLELEAETLGERPRVSLRLSGVGLDDVKSLFLAVAQRYAIQAKQVWYRIRLRPRRGDYITTPEFTGDEAREINDYIKYYTYEGG